MIYRISWLLCVLLFGHFVSSRLLSAQEPRWQYSAEHLQPFWLSSTVYAEPILFVRDEQSGETRGQLLFSAEKIIAVSDSSGMQIYQQGSDYRLGSDGRSIIVPAGSSIVTKAPGDLRVPAGSQRFRLTHKDGTGEILFGARLEYHNMQTCVTYSMSNNDWPVETPSFDASILPQTINKLKNGNDVSIVLLGDSISSGCNASGWADGAPYQPPFPNLLRQHLQHQYGANVTLENLAVSGKSTPWGLTQIEAVIQHRPDLVIIAFGMNDSAGLSAEAYGKNTARMIAKARELRPQTEFILVATMLGNRDWTLLKHDVFPEFREQLKSLCEPGVALADLTSVWDEFLKRKQDRDLTGNGVNHPNDFGHRVYAQVLASLLVPPNN